MMNREWMEMVKSRKVYTKTVILLLKHRKHIGKETVTKTCAGTMKVHR